MWFKKRSPAKTPVITDPGLEALTDIHRRLMIDDQWTMRASRAFSWIAHRLSQTVGASAMFESHEIMISRVTSSVTVIEDIGEARETVEGVIGELNQIAIGSAYVHDQQERTVYAMLAHNVHSESLQFRPDEIASCQIIALVQAEVHADILAERLKAAVARRQHPASGQRVHPDDMLNVMADVYQPWGRKPNRFANADEIGHVYDMVRDTYDFSAGGGEDGIAIEVAFGEEHTTLIQLKTDEPHPVLGQGLGVFLTLPLSVDANEAATVANRLNLRQFERGETIAALGAWCVRNFRGQPHVGHAHFVPNANFLPRRAMDCAMAAVNRAVWADGLFHPQLGRRSSLPAIANRIGYDLRPEWSDGLEAYAGHRARSTTDVSDHDVQRLLTEAEAGAEEPAIRRRMA